MFSWEYVWRLVTTAVRYPGTVSSSLRGEDVGAALNRRRMERWSRTRGEYLERPKRSLGFRIFLNPDDDSQTSALIATTGRLNLPLTCLLSEVLRPGMRMVDVGANLGFYSLLAARAVGGGGRVWAFEPEPRNLGLLKRSIEANGFRNVEPVQLALSKSPGPARLYLAPQSEPNAHTITRDRGVGSLDVTATTLDEFWGERGRLDLLKVHVFGDEPIVLSGSRKVLRVSRPMVVTRFGSKAWEEGDAPGLLDDLFSWYRVYEIVGSPRLLKPIARSSLVAGVHRGIFMAPMA